MFLKRLGPDPHANGKNTPQLAGCPDLWALSDGSFAIIGADITEEALRHMPPTASCGPDERVIRIPRETLIAAKADIPEL
jgi:hypothetical protein